MIHQAEYISGITARTDLKRDWKKNIITICIIIDNFFHLNDSGASIDKSSSLYTYDGL